jgi:hypothetical protein
MAPSLRDNPRKSPKALSVASSSKEKDEANKKIKSLQHGKRHHQMTTANDAPVTDAGGGQQVIRAEAYVNAMLYSTAC